MVQLKTFTLVATFILVFFPQDSFSQSCPGIESLEDFKGKSIGLKNNALLFSTNILKLDIDGSSRSYGMHDQGAEHICNGLSPISPQECQAVVQRGNCFKHCVAKFREWHKSGHDPETLDQYMRSIGLGGGHGSIPKVELQSAPNDEMFVSHTSVRYGPWEKGQPSVPIDKQEAQLEPFEVPFFVIPANFRSAPWDATPGDFGVAVNAQDPSSFVLFVVGDVGGNLDEGSAKLQELLKGKPVTSIMKKNVLGKLVERYGDSSLSKYKDGSDLDLRIAIFRHTSSYDRSKSGSRIILQSAHNQKQILSEISKKGEKMLNDLGGAAMVVECTNHL